MPKMSDEQWTAYLAAKAKRKRRDHSRRRVRLARILAKQRGRSYGDLVALTQDVMAGRITD